MEHSATAWSKIRKLSFLGLPVFAGIVIGVILLPIVSMAFGPKTIDGTVKQLFSQAAKRVQDNHKFYYKVGDLSVSKAYLDNLFIRLQKYAYGKRGALSKIHNINEKKAFLRLALEAELFSEMAMKEKLLADPEMASLFILGVKKTLADLYFYSRIREGIDTFEQPLNEKEIKTFYEKNKKAYKKKNISKKVALESIRTVLGELKSRNTALELAVIRRKLFDRMRSETGVQISDITDFGF